MFIPESFLFNMHLLGLTHDKFGKRYVTFMISHVPTLGYYRAHSNTERILIYCVHLMTGFNVFNYISGIRLFCLFVQVCWSFTAQSTTRSCRAGQLIVALFLGRLRPSKRLTSTKRGRPRQ